MRSGATEARSTSVARFNRPGRQQPKKAGDRGPGSATVKPRIARLGLTKFLTLGDLDARTKAAQRARQIIASIEQDLGGADRMSEAQRQLAQRAALLSVQAEDYEVRFLQGLPHEVPDYLATCNNLRRMFEALGLERRMRDVTPPIREYLAEAARQARHKPAGGDEGETAHG
jgi:hypothetical protein